MGRYSIICIFLAGWGLPGSSCRNVERELINHRSLLHPNIIRFKEVFVTSTHLSIVMEYAAGGELFDRIVRRPSRFTPSSSIILKN